MKGKIDLVNLNCGNGCCPDAIFSDDTVVLNENNQTILLTKESLGKLFEEAKKRGLIE